MGRSRQVLAPWYQPPRGPDEKTGAGMAIESGKTADTRKIALPGAVLGFGLGGFVDGILLHQILQWHHMLTSTDHDNIGVNYSPADTVSGLRMNTGWDGLFHAVAWVSVLL